MVIYMPIIESQISQPETMTILKIEHIKYDEIKTGPFGSIFKIKPFQEWLDDVRRTDKPVHYMKITTDDYALEGCYMEEFETVLLPYDLNYTKENLDMISSFVDFDDYTVTSMELDLYAVLYGSYFAIVKS